MKAFCPNCGTENEGMPGGRITCQACTASFEVPREDFGIAPPPPAAPPISYQQPAPPPPAASSIPPELRSSAPPIMPQGYVGPPPSGFGAGLASGGNQTNPLSIVSLVLGILCCLPFSIGAIITGVISYGQITNSNGAQKGQGLSVAGIVLGCLGLLMNLIGLISSALSRH